MYNKKEYNEFVQNNSNLTKCQKKEFINTKLNTFYIDNKSNKQIITYINQSTKTNDYRRLIRLYILFNHFLKYDFVDRLINGIKIKRYSDDKIYAHVTKHPEEYQKKNILDRNIHCSQYTYTFEELALVLYDKYFKGKIIKYLDVSCGDGHKTKLFGTKLNLSEKNIWGTDIEEWGPYKANKQEMPINFKLLKNNKLDFADNEFDILSIFFALHHIPLDSVHKLLAEFSRVLKPTGILIIIEHNILNDFDHLIVDIEHSMNSYIWDKKPDDTHANYFNYVELDFIMGQHNFSYAYGNPMTSNVGFDVRYDNPYYGLYLNKKIEK